MKIMIALGLALALTACAGTPNPNPPTPDVQAQQRAYAKQLRDERGKGQLEIGWTTWSPTPGAPNQQGGNLPLPTPKK
jgi:hypothetical protein